MTQNIKFPENLPKSTVSQRILSGSTLYRGFASIDQEMEREIAMQWFTKTKGIPTLSKKNTYRAR